MINGALVQVHLTVGWMGSLTHPVVISPIPECIIVSWQNPFIGSLTCRVRPIIVRMVKLKPIELPLPRKVVNQKQYYIFGGISEISDTKVLERFRGGDSHHSSVNKKELLSA